MAAGARHAHTGDPRARRIRLATVLLVWLAGLAAGFFAILASFVRFGCGDGDDGLACQNSGTALAIAVVVGVIAIVTVVTVLTYEREPRRIVITGVGGLIALAALFLAARSLLSTV